MSGEENVFRAFYIDDELKKRGVLIKGDRKTKLVEFESYIFSK